MSVRRPLLDRNCHRAGLLMVLVGISLALPSLGNGFWGDDHLHMAMLEGAPVLPETHPLDLFNFAAGDLLDTSQPGALGPWWTADDFRGRFFRPLTSATHALDQALWGRWAMGHHLTTLLLWAALLVVVAAFLRELCQVSGRGPPAVLLAGLVYAVDEAHAVPVQWLANRNALVAVLLAVVSIHAYVRWRRHGRPRWLALSLVAFGLAALGGETAVAVPAWAVAWELTMTRGPARERVLAATPLVMAAALYLGLYSGFGFGTTDSALYTSPLSDPVGFLTEALPARWPLLAAATLTPIPAEITMSLPPSAAVPVAVLCALVVVVFLVLVLPLIRRDRTVRFALVAAALSLVPVCGTFTHNRVLLLPTVGTAWLIGCWLDDCTKEWWHARDRRFHLARTRRSGFWAIAIMHGLLPVLTWPAATYMVRTMSAGQVDLAIEAAIDDSEAVRDDLVLMLNLPDAMSVLNLPTIRHLSGLPDPAGLHILTLTPAGQRLVRTGDRSFTLEARPPGYLHQQLEGLYRGQPVDAGEVFDSYAAVGLTVRADRVDGDDLLRFEVTLDRSLDSPDATLLAWDGVRMARFEPPEIGGCALVPFTDPMLPVPTGLDWPDDACAGIDATPGPVLEQAPDPPTAGCALELLEGDHWVHRADVRCPGDDGLVFASVGDPGRPGEILDHTIGELQRVCAEAGCSLMVLPGDLLYGPGRKAGKTWRRVWDDGLAHVGVPALGILGNHSYRHEADPHLKRKALYAADGRRGFVLPGPSYTARVSRDGQPLVAFAGLDTDSLAVPRPDAPGLGEQALHDACGLGVPVVLFGHHPLSSQGTHHGHEQGVRRGLRELSRAVIQGDGCRLVVALAGHDHDQQVYPPGCQEPINPGIVVSGVAARGYRGRGSEHLETCPSSGQRGGYHFGPRDAGGFALLRIDPDTAATRVQIYDVPGRGEHEVLSDLSW